MKIASVLYVSDMLNGSAEEYEKIVKEFPNYDFENSPDDEDLFRRMLDAKNYNCIMYDNSMWDLYTMCEGPENGVHKLSIMGVGTISYLKGLSADIHGTEVCMSDNYWPLRFKDMGLIQEEWELARTIENMERHRREFGLPAEIKAKETDDSPMARLIGIMDPCMPVFMLTWPRIDIRSGKSEVAALSTMYRNAKRHGVIRNYGSTKDAMEFLSHPVVTF